MANDPELKAMSDVFEALQGLDGNMQKRVVDWVLAKLQSPGTSNTKGAKRDPKPGSKKGRQAASSGSSSLSGTGAKRGPKPSSKRGRKRGPKPGSGGKA